MAYDTVLLGHGSGGQMMKRLIDELFFECFGSPELVAVFGWLIALATTSVFLMWQTTSTPARTLSPMA